MKKLSDPAALSHYADLHGLRDIFHENTMLKMELFVFEKGEAICSAGEQLTHMLLLVNGKIKLYKSLPNGKSVLIRFYRPLAVVGDLELMTDNPVNCMVESVGETVAIGIPMDSLKQTAYDNAPFLRFIIRQLSSKLITFSNASSLNLLYPLENRFASYLVSITEDAGREGDADEIKTAKLTEIAELLGTSYRHLNRVITRLASEGVLERKRGAISVRDIRPLKKLAEGNLYS